MNYFWKDLYDRIWRLDIITHEFWWLYPHGNNGTMGVACPLEAALLLPVCSTSSHVNSSSNIFWGAQPKQKHGTQRGVGGSSPWVRGTRAGDSMQDDGHMDRGSGDSSMWAVTVRSLDGTRWLWSQAANKEEQNPKQADTAPVCQRVGLWRLRLFTFNRPCPCAAAAERSSWIFQCRGGRVTPRRTGRVPQDQ